MKHDANVSSNSAAEQVQFFFIMHFVIILHNRSQGNVLLNIFRNTFELGKCILGLKQCGLVHVLLSVKILIMAE